MSKIEDVARAFAQGKSARCSNAHTDGTSYVLHSSTIAYHTPEGVNLSWCGYRTVTTQNHLRHIADALSVPMRLSRKDSPETFTLRRP